MASSFGTCERNWVALDFINSKRCNNLKPSSSNDLVYVFSNIRLVNRMKNVSKLDSFSNASSSRPIANLEFLVNDFNNEDNDNIQFLSNTSLEDEIDDIN